MEKFADESTLQPTPDPTSAELERVAEQEAVMSLYEKGLESA